MSYFCGLCRLTISGNLQPQIRKWFSRAFLHISSLDDTKMRPKISGNKLLHLLYCTGQQERYADYLTGLNDIIMLHEHPLLTSEVLVFFFSALFHANQYALRFHEMGQFASSESSPSVHLVGYEGMRRLLPNAMVVK
uniref:Rab-GAP TBC domain-containing protein n=1 Tax=Heterorhabditis bacteriophora TaxID=37862 RepID=A0A1I7WV13_HETBA